MGGYPIGAMYDANAPYNKVDYREVYESEINDQVKVEMESHDTMFVEWLENNSYLPEYIDDDTDRKVIESLVDDTDVFDKYKKYREQDLIEELIET